MGRLEVDAGKDSREWRNHDMKMFWVEVLKAINIVETCNNLRAAGALSKDAIRLYLEKVTEKMYPEVKAACDKFGIGREEFKKMAFRGVREQVKNALGSDVLWTPPGTFN